MRLLCIALVLSGTCALGGPAADSQEKRLDTVTARRLDTGYPLQPVPRWTAPGRPTLALALSGGGARGIAHVGVLQALHEDGVEVDGIAGTSLGALIGAFASAGYWPDEIEHILSERDWNDILSGLDVRNRILSRTEDIRQAGSVFRLRFRGHRGFQIGALVDSRPFERELYRYFMHAQVASGGDFDRLRHRFRPVATDVLTGRAVVPARGDLVAMVRGSSAFPGVFRPVPFGDALLVDGGLVENVPVDSARSLGMDAVLAVDLSEKVASDPNVRSAFDLLNRSVNVLMSARTQELRDRADLLLQPDAADYSSSDFGGHVAELTRTGRDAYDSNRARLWSILEERAKDRARLDYDRIEVEGTDWIDANALATRLGGGTGVASRYRIAAELARALNLGPLADGRVEWVETASGRVLRFSFTESQPVGGISIEGPTVEDLSGTDDLSSVMGQPFSLETARRLAWQSRQRLIDQGRVLVTLERLEWDAETATMSAKVADTPVGDISMSVSDNLRLERTERFLSDLQGQRFRFDQVADRLDELVIRGSIFDWTLEPRMGERDSVDLEVRVQGEDYYDLAATIEYRDALSWAGAARLAKSNITGRGDFVDLILEKALETEAAQLRYRTEYGIGFQNLGAEIGVRYFNNAFPFVDGDQRLDESLDEEYRGTRSWLSVIHRLRWGAVVRAGLTHERDKLRATALEPAETRSRSSVFLSLDLDRHDRLLFPTRGSALTIQGEHSLSGDDLWKYELSADGSISPGEERRQTLSFRGGMGLSDGADRRPFWFDPGGHRRLYGFIPYGAAAPQYLRGGTTWRLRWFNWGAARVYLEVGADAIRTALSRGDLDGAETAYGYGASLTAHTDFLGPVTVGVARNDADATTAFLTFGFGLFDR